MRPENETSDPTDDSQPSTGTEVNEGSLNVVLPSKTIEPSSQSDNTRSPGVVDKVKDFSTVQPELGKKGKPVRDLIIPDKANTEKKTGHDRDSPGVQDKLNQNE